MVVMRHDFGWILLHAEIRYQARRVKFELHK